MKTGTAPKTKDTAQTVTLDKYNTNSSNKARSSEIKTKTSLHTFQPSLRKEKPLHAKPFQNKHGSTTLPQDPCSLLLNHHSIYNRERVMVQEHHREFEAPWGLAMVG